MTIKTCGPNTTSRYRLNDVLELAARIVDRSGAVPAILGPDHRTDDATFLRGMLILLFSTNFTKGRMSTAEVARMVTESLTEEQRLDLGIRLTEDDLAALASESGPTRRNKILAIYQRLYTKYQRLIDPIDSSPLVDGRKKYTRADYAVAARPDEAERIARQDHVMNLLISASITYQSDPADAPHDAIPNWKGDVVIDATHVTLGLAFGKAISVKSPNHRMKSCAHLRRNKHALAADITAVVSVGRPDGLYVPPYILAATVGNPKGADVPRAMDALDLLEQGGLRPPFPRTQHQYCVVDQGYSNGKYFNAGLLQRNYTLVCQTSKDRKKGTARREANRHNLATAQSAAPGPFLFNGRIFCPGMRPLLDVDYLQCPEPEADGAAWSHYREREKALFLGLMPTNGRPQRMLDRGRGRPKNGTADEHKYVYRVQVRCPGRSGNAICPLLENRGMTWDEGTGRVPAAPQAARESHLPECCQNMSTTVTMTEKQFKQYQGFVRDSEAHRDWYKFARSHNERAFVRLSEPTGANLRDRATRNHRDGAMIINWALAIAICNVIARENYEDDLEALGTKATIQKRLRWIQEREVAIALTSKEPE